MPVPTKLRHKKRQSLPSGRVLQLFSNTHLSNCTTSKGEEDAHDIARWESEQLVFSLPLSPAYQLTTDTLHCDNDACRR